MKINYLEPLRGIATKTFLFDPEKEVWNIQSSYRAGKKFNGYSYEVSNIREAYEIIKKYHRTPRFMIQGGFKEGIELKDIYRLKRARTVVENGIVKELKPTLEDRPLQFFCLDVDDYQCDYQGTDAVEYFIAQLPSEFWEADYIYQFSASYGLISTDLKCHLFFWLEKEILNTDLRNWCRDYNEKQNWRKILDPAVFTATQPIYTQRRICKGAPDPVENLLGFVEKTGNLEWKPVLQSPSSKKSVSGYKSSYISATQSNSDFSIGKSIEKILKGESFHNELRSSALSLCNQGFPIKKVKEMLKGIMNSARSGLTAQRLETWKTRYNDIDRLVEGCFQLLLNPSQQDLLEWLKIAPPEQVLKEFASKVFRKTDEELIEIIDIVHTRTKISKAVLLKRVRQYKKFSDQKSADEQRVKLREDRAKRNIYEVIVNKHNYAQAADEIARILSASSRKPPVFSTYSGLHYIEEANAVTIREMSRRSREKKAGRKIYKGTIMRTYNRPFHSLIGRMGMDIRFVEKELGEEIKCPDIVAGIVGTGQSKYFREITGIVECPFIQRDYTPFNQHGYDKTTGLYSTVQEKIPDLQSPEKAYEYLVHEVFAEFPFKDKLSEAVMVSAVLALMQRPVLAQDPAGMPGFGITAPVQSSGKTTLVNTAANIIYQRSLSASTFSEDDEELTKHILAVFDENHSCILFDNLKQGSEVKSDVLAKAMSSEIFSGRLLGVNKTLTLQSAVIWFFTGNNITFTGDFSTRIFPIELNPRMENPEERIFKRENVIEWVLEKRLYIISALFSLILGASDIEMNLPTASRFRLWDKYIRDPIYFASGIDVNQAININKEKDQDFMLKKNLITNIYEVFKNKLITSRDIINNAFVEDGGNILLSEPLEELLGKKYCDQPKSLGRMLSRMVDRTYNNLSLIRENKDRAYWQIVCRDTDEISDKNEYSY